jgi:hypothetical protein
MLTTAEKFAKSPIKQEEDIKQEELESEYSEISDSDASGDDMKLDIKGIYCQIRFEKKDFLSI